MNLLLKDIPHYEDFAFSPQNVEYLPLPIICQGSLAGIIYLLYAPRKYDEEKRSKDVKSFKHYYRIFLLQATREYERVLLESKFRVYASKPQDPLEDYWHVFNDLKTAPNKENRKDISYKFMYDNLGPWKPVITSNPFLLNLGFDDYYEHQAPVLTEESQQLQTGRRERVRTAITAIIVDSFAHNIGAHSLVGLKWWFENRYRIAAMAYETEGNLRSFLKLEDKGDRILNDLIPTIEFHTFMDAADRKQYEAKLSMLNVIRFMGPEIQQNILAYKDSDGDKIAQFPLPIAQSIYQFFQYLRDKSAFWSGVARDTVFSGRIRSWQELIRDFLNNTLFLGTITHSEGINKLFFHIEIIDKNGKIKAGGEYAQINLEVMEREKAQALKKAPIPYKKDPQGYSEYAFLRKGKHFDKIHPVLGELDEVFLPNGVIGQHALYTILENTLRNVKHYKSGLKKFAMKVSAFLFLSKK